MSALSDRVSQFSRQHSLWKADTRVVAAVSGGSDSVALAFLLRDLAARGGPVLAAIAHLNHHIRGAEADADAAFVKTLAERIDVPFVAGDADVPADASRDGMSLELAGRHARQRFYAEAIASVGAASVSVAHTRDDQAETVLLRLTRGAGTAGLGGMAPRRGHVVRPLLEVTRAHLQDFLRALGESWREDATNLDRAIPRNLIRHEVMPRLRSINAQADAALSRTADILRADAEFLETLANAAFLRIVETSTEHEKVTVNAVELARLPKALARRVARYALETVNPSRSYGLEEADELCRVASGGTGGKLPGLAMERLGAAVVLTSREHRAHPVLPAVDPFELRLNVPGTVEAPHGAWAVTAEGPMPVSRTGDPKKGSSPRDTVVGDRSVIVDASDLGSHLIVRARRPGDRLQPLGAPGRKKVQDVLVDRKVPRDDRDRVPIVTNKDGRIVWVAGEVLADPFRVTPLTKSVVVLTLRRQ